MDKENSNLQRLANKGDNSWKWSKEAGFFLLLLISLVVFFKDALLGNIRLIWDAADYFYPNFFFVSQSLRNCAIPLWNPYLLNGYPIIANIEAQIFYPINLLFLPFTAFTPYAMQLHIILHFFIAGASMYALTKIFINNRFAALLSAFVYMYSGFMVGHIQHVTMIEVIAWLPLVFLLTEKALGREKIVYAVYAGFFLGVSILAGHPQSSHSIVFLLIVYTLYRAITTYLKNRQKKFLLFSLSVIAVCAVIGVLIAAVQILPTYEVVRESTRGEPVSYYVAANSGQFSLKDAVSVIMPNYFGALTLPYWGDLDISQGIIYIGIIPTLLMGLALLFDRKRAGVGFFSVMALFSLLLALGTNGPLFKLFYSYVPGFKFFRAPAHTVFIYMFCASLLAGFGFDTLSRDIKRVTLYCYLYVFAIFCVAVYFLSPSPPSDFAVYGTRNIHNAYTAAFGILVAAIFIIVLSVHFPRYRKFFFCLLLLVTFSDLYFHFSDALTLGLKKNPHAYEMAPHTIQAIKEDAGVASSNTPGTELNYSELKNGLFRIYTRPEGVQGTGPLGFDRPMIFRTFMVEGFEPLDLSRHRKLISTLSAKNFDNLLKITNSRYITSKNNNNLIWQSYSNSLPRAYVVANARFMENDDRILERLAVNEPSSEVVIAGKGTDVLGETMTASDWSADVAKYTEDRIEIKTKLQKDGFLVLSDTYYPGWQVMIDGLRSSVMRANYDFRAAFLPKGDHTVVFEYHPYYLKIGIAVSAMTLLFVIGCIFISRGRFRKD